MSQALTISTSALIASSLCGAVHSAGVPFGQPQGTGLCFDAAASVVQKAAGKRAARAGYALKDLSAPDSDQAAAVQPAFQHMSTAVDQLTSGFSVWVSAGM